MIAEKELREEEFRQAVAAEKERLRRQPRAWWRRVLNVRVRFYIKGESK